MKKALAIIIGLAVAFFLFSYIYVLINKESIIASLKSGLTQKINGEITMGKIDISIFSQFPSIAVVVENITIKDSLYSVHHHPTFIASKVAVEISVLKLILQNNPLNRITIHNAQLYLYTDTTGYSNSYLLSPKSSASTTSTSNSKTEIEKVKLKNVRLVMNDEKKGKLFDFEVQNGVCDIENEGIFSILSVKNDMHIHHLAFNLKRGSYLKEAQFNGNLKIVVNKEQKQLSFETSQLKINKQPFSITGNFNFVANDFNIKIVSNNIDYNFARQLLTKQLSTVISIVNLDNKLKKVTANISGLLNGGEPNILISYDISNSNLKTPFVSFNNCSFSGKFTNELIKGLPLCDENSRIELNNFSGLLGNLKVESKNIFVDNLTEPVLKADFKSNFKLEQINSLLASNTVDFVNGNGLLDIAIEAPLFKSEKIKTKINGYLTIENGLLHYISKNIDLTKTSCSVLFKNSDVYINNLVCTANGNLFVMNGTGINLNSFMPLTNEKADIQWSFYSPNINLDKFNSLFQPSKQIIKSKRNNAPLSNISKQIDEVVQQANFHLHVKADKLSFKKFAASEANAIIDIVNEQLLIKNISLKHGGGSMDISGEMKEKNSTFYSSFIKLNMKEVDINKVMYAFDDFGQTGISYRNLRGKVSATANINMDLDKRLSARPANMVGYVDFSLKNGKLLDYEPLKKIQNIIFKRRNFDEVSFAELKDRFDINNNEILINRMEIQSSALTLFVEGKYDLKGNHSDISIQVPLRNLKKRDDLYIVENKGSKSKGGASIYLRGQSGNDGTVQFKLDIFKKFRKS